MSDGLHDFMFRTDKRDWKICSMCGARKDCKWWTPVAICHKCDVAMKEDEG